MQKVNIFRKVTVLFFFILVAYSIQFCQPQRSTSLYMGRQIETSSAANNRDFPASSGQSPRHLKRAQAEEMPYRSGYPLSLESELHDPAVTHTTDEYDLIRENIFITPQSSPFSTFSIDVDGASYTNARSMIAYGQLPLKDAVRVEEFINYFTYDYPDPKADEPFEVITEVASCPWNASHQLVHIGLQGRKLDMEALKPSNLVFLIDVSGSMEDANKLPLLRSSFKLLVNELGEDDKVSIVVYAGASGLVLPPTPASQKDQIIAALDKLAAGGSTAGGQGMQLAYKVATENFLPEGNNRVILATDGDFNVGVSSTSELVRMVENQQKSGIYLTILGFGMGNYKDGRMEQISNAGNGNYYYIDHIKEAKKVFVTDMRATLFTIAKDVKIQVEFNPEKVQAYRLIGYENRKLKDEEFNDDTKDAGELGAGHTVTALYEIIPVGVESSFVKSVDAPKYQQPKENAAAFGGEMATVKLRYKKPDEDTSLLLSEVIKTSKNNWEEASENFRFSAAVAAFGMLLRDSEFKSNTNYSLVKELAANSIGKDEEGYRKEFVELVGNCELMAGKAEASR